MKLSYFMIVCLLLAFVSCVSSQSSDHQSANTTVSNEGPKSPMSRSLFNDMMDLVLSLYTKDGNGTMSATGLKSPLSRAVKASTSTITSLSYGNLALLSAVVLGGLAYAAPGLFTDYRRRVGPLPAMSYPLYPQRFMDGLNDLSAEMIPFLENEIQRGHHYYYKRNKRSTAPQSSDERLGLHDFISNRFMTMSESVMSYVERSLDNMPNLPRLEAQACMKRCICEAHNQPKKYGLTGLVLQLFFPPYIENDFPSKIIAKYQLAARYGRSEHANCAMQYDDCILNFLDVIQSLSNLIL